VMHLGPAAVAALIPFSATAGQMLAAKPDHVVSWFSPYDMPTDILATGGAHLVKLRTTIRPDGSIQDCRIEISSHDKHLDDLTCAIMLKRGKFAPARSQDGSPIYGVFRTAVTWQATDGPHSGEPADMDLYLSKLPAGVRSGELGGLILMIDNNGRPTACQPSLPDPTTPQDEPETRDPELLSLACGQIMEGWKTAPAKSDSGETVPSVQNASVRFHIGQ
jgi:uncharacterized protein (DUF3820 family)